MEEKKNGKIDKSSILNFDDVLSFCMEQNIVKPMLFESVIVSYINNNDPKSAINTWVKWLDYKQDKPHLGLNKRDNSDRVFDPSLFIRQAVLVAYLQNCQIDNVKPDSKIIVSLLQLEEVPSSYYFTSLFYRNTIDQSILNKTKKMFINLKQEIIDFAEPNIFKEIDDLASKFKVDDLNKKFYQFKADSITRICL